MTISIIIPCYNEQENIKETVKDIKKVIIKLKERIEIVVVNDHSSDSTEQIVKELEKKDRRIIFYPE